MRVNTLFEERVRECEKKSPAVSASPPPLAAKDDVFVTGNGLNVNLSETEEKRIKLNLELLPS